MIAKGNLDASVTFDRHDEIGSLADDFNTMRESVKQANEKLEEYARTLEKKVEQRTENLEKTLEELKQSQSKLIQSEKMAALGQLIAGVAHEINTPLGAIRSSIGNISDSLQETLEQLPMLFRKLSEEDMENFLALVSRSQANETSLSSKEERRLRKKMTRKLEEYEIENADNVADTLTDICVYDDIYRFLPLFRHPRGQLILHAAYNLSGLQRSSRNIITATDRASKVVFALKSYARFDYSEEMIESDITEGIETVLTLYHNHLKHGIEVVRNYGEVPFVTCYPDELNQVWTNIIHNAVHAMENQGTMKIETNREKEKVVITITDSGKGIPEEIKKRIFDPFFTTKARGEGSGLGLDIVRKIVEKHKGEIKVESEPGKTAFSIILPINHPQS
ncbi:MAG: GHKL domain-containing protein [Desulfobacterales bacterium]|nr:GHKL domain-containing protein [Desulfobacterales bacterium]